MSNLPNEPTPKQKYRKLCEQKSSIPIFSQAWWLDSVAGDNWDVVLVKKGDTIQASLPFVTRKRFGLTVLGMPPLTQTLGPWMRLSSAKYAKQLSQEKDLLQALYAQLPAHSAQSKPHISRLVRPTPNCLKPTVSCKVCVGNELFSKLSCNQSLIF